MTGYRNDTNADSNKMKCIYIKIRGYLNVCLIEYK